MATSPAAAVGAAAPDTAPQAAETHSRAWRVWRGVGVAGLAVLLVAGCAAEGSADTSTAGGAGGGVQELDAGGSDGSRGADEFAAAFTEEGLECEGLADDKLRQGVVEQLVCRGDDHVIVTIRDYGNADARDTQLDVIADSACTIAETGQDIQRVAVSDSWILMPGGDRDIDFELFGNAMATLDLDWTDYTC